MSKIDELRNRSGRVYVYLENEKIFNKFAADAEAEGYMFGKNKPTDSPYDDLVAIESNKQLCYVGSAGHMLYHNPESVAGKFTRVDYQKYVSGSDDAILVTESNNKANYDEDDGEDVSVSTMFNGIVDILGAKADEAKVFIEQNMSNCTNAAEEWKILENAEQSFDVFIVESDE